MATPDEIMAAVTLVADAARARDEASTRYVAAVEAERLAYQAKVATAQLFDDAWRVLMDAALEPKT